MALMWKSCFCHLNLPIFNFTPSCYGLETEQGLKGFFYLLVRQQKHWGLGERSGCLLICELYFITKEEEELEVPLEGLGFQQQESRLCQQMKMATVAPPPEPVCWHVEPVPSTNSGHVCTPGRSFLCLRQFWNGVVSCASSVGTDCCIGMPQFVCLPSVRGCRVWCIPGTAWASWAGALPSPGGHSCMSGMLNSMAAKADKKPPVPAFMQYSLCIL